MDMGEQKRPGEAKEHLYEMIREFDTAMLVTDSEDRELRGRPMAIAEVGADGSLWFTTSATSPKVDEIKAHDHIAVMMQSSERFISLSGHGEIIRDKNHLRRLWRESWRAWFPRGVDDPDVVLLRLRPVEGEYWDIQGWRGARYVFEAVIAAASGERLGDGDADWNAKVKESRS
jgi:general stress protein 26